MSDNHTKQIGNWNGFLTDGSTTFNEKVEELNKELEKALESLHADPSNPVYLSDYQALVSEYQLYRSAQSNITKTYKDVSSGIISNFR